MVLLVQVCRAVEQHRSACWQRMCVLDAQLVPWCIQNEWCVVLAYALPLQREGVDDANPTKGKDK